MPKCKLNFQAQLKAFHMENAKVNYTMSFLKGTALNYFELFLDTPDDEPAWLKDYELFIEELLINFSLRVSYCCHEISKSTSLDCNKICSDGVK